MTESDQVTPTTVSDELSNDVMTVTRLQVAIAAAESPAQSALTKLTLETDTSTPAGLFDLLQQVTQLLLEQRDTWTHFGASSESFEAIAAAEERFNQLSLQERAKFSAETLTNVDGVVRQKTEQAEPKTETDGYLVVTLLLGTAHDAPLFTEVTQVDQMRDRLQTILMLDPAYLLVLEVLWTPQQTDEVLSAAELETYFGDLGAIA
ncbi:MAG TPA: DUF1517 domain-containing protein [Leptolyngbyaceae cyanobacterium M33_DOE_097]|uniref:DUF1517 domain-containing protein n=1 Tax=Oscillatoriales cyanobacterium SpSt-418 TaxID=2282169 RepID=A0A7C3KCG5_9CYAN|nr:DUF1517 domain-containing protein [Leptolyngbyaceae cyanobacterium M33_DOE_097]